MDLREINGMQEKNIRQLKRMDVETVEDLLKVYPEKYQPYPDPVMPCHAYSGVCAVAAYVDPYKFRSYGKCVKAWIMDNKGGKVLLIWYNKPYFLNQFQKDTIYVFYGEAVSEDAGLTMTHPDLYTLETYMTLAGSHLPVYPVKKGLSQIMMRRFMRQAIHLSLKGEQVTIPEETYRKRNLLCHESALWNIHFPKSSELIEPARKTLAFEEFYSYIYEIQLRNSDESGNLHPIKDTGIKEKVLSVLSYELTSSQKKAICEIEEDFNSAKMMNRLLQADVGAGKTIVGIILMLEAADNGYQTAFMAPTMILAKQHYEEMVRICALIGKEDFAPQFLAGDSTAKEKKSIYKKLSSGKSKIVIGTHALIHEKVEFQNLAFLVIDEQQRFGVKQRNALWKKGDHPHMLSMSATPIPRTLAGILFGGMDVTKIVEKPLCRLPIKSCIVKQEYRQTSYNFIKKQIELGHQAYIICPSVEEIFIEEDDIDRADQKWRMELMSVEWYQKHLDEVFPGIPSAILHGQMNGPSKKKIMESFLSGEVKILVSTTVIEEGVDVPNATVILVEDANMFGLLQLHQIRGRVGRGKEQSYCIFMCTDEKSKEKLQILWETNDGFEIAEKDMELRGAGQLFGIKQSGEMDFKVGDLFKDRELMEEAFQDVTEAMQHTEEKKQALLLTDLSMISSGKQ